MNTETIVGIFGYPIEHTLSPVLQNAAFQAAGLSSRYLPFEVHPTRLKAAMASIVALGLKGVNITRPHKEAVLPYLDRLTHEAQHIGAVNTIERVGDRLIGHNTDGAGFLRSLRESGVDPAGVRVILLGAGGAARAVAVSLLAARISELVILARSATRARVLADDLNRLSRGRVKIGRRPFDATPDLSDGATLLINTTPLGMKKADPLPYPSAVLREGWVVADLIYTPFKTPLLKAAERRGLVIVPGAGMLLHQGALAFEIWTKQKAPLEVMRKALYKALRHRRAS